MGLSLFEKLKLAENYWNINSLLENILKYRKCFKDNYI